MDTDLLKRPLSVSGPVRLAQYLPTFRFFFFFFLIFKKHSAHTLSTDREEESRVRWSWSWSWGSRLGNANFPGGWAHENMVALTASFASAPSAATITMAMTKKRSGGAVCYAELSFPSFLPKQVENIKDTFARKLATRIDRLPVPVRKLSHSSCLPLEFCSIV